MFFMSSTSGTIEVRLLAPHKALHALYPRPKQAGALGMFVHNTPFKNIERHNTISIKVNFHCLWWMNISSFIKRTTNLMKLANRS